MALYHKLGIVQPQLSGVLKAKIVFLLRTFYNVPRLLSFYFYY